MTQLEAIRELAGHDHSILKGGHARDIAHAFGLEEISTGLIQDQRSEFKGAYFPDLQEGEWAEDVIDAARLACEIADHLGVEYPPMFGRGSQIRAACEAIQQHLISQQS